MRRRNRNKRQIKIFISTTICFLLIMTAGNAAFSTNITLTASGNIKDVYHTVSFKTNLIKNSTLETLDGWIPAASTLTIDENLKYQGFNSVRIYEANSFSWSGINSKEIITPYKSNQLYEMSVYAYRDSSSEYGDLNTVLRGYTPAVKTADIPNWDGYLCTYYHYININTSVLPDRTWKQFKSQFTTAVTSDCNYFDHYRLDYNATKEQVSSNIWIALPSFYEINQKQVKKYTKLGELPVATKEGYIFTGWYSEEYGGEKVNEDTEITSDISYYARFIKE